MRSAIVGTLLLGSLGCAGPELYRARLPLDEPTPEAAPSGRVPQLLSAHFARAPAHEPVELLLVFSVEIDPTTLAPDAFVVVLDNGDFVLPQRALLNPADEYDENRSVTLIGAFGTPTETPPTAVRVVGNVYAEDGSALSGLNAAIRAHDVPDELVWIEILRPDEFRCVGARQVVRTYWSDNLRAVHPDDLGRVTVSFSDGSEAKPVGFDDHAAMGADDDAGDDNVLDLCLARDAPVSAVTVAAGVFEDAAGHPTAASTRGPSGG